MVHVIVSDIQLTRMHGCIIILLLGWDRRLLLKVILAEIFFSSFKGPHSEGFLNQGDKAQNFLFPGMSFIVQQL